MPTLANTIHKSTSNEQSKEIDLDASSESLKLHSNNAALNPCLDNIIIKSKANNSSSAKFTTRNALSLD